MFSNSVMPEALDFDENRNSLFLTCRSKIVALCIVTEYQCDSFQAVGSQMSHYFHVSAVIVRLFFGSSWTSHSRSCDLLVAHDPSLHLTNKHSHSHLFLATFTLRWQLCGAGPWCCIGSRSLGGPVLNLLLCMGQNENILFLLVHEACA